MVCQKCEAKLSATVTPDVWKEGAKNVGKQRESTTTNRLLSDKRKAGSRFSPYEASETKCKLCKSQVHQEGGHYCQACAYKNGICAMCGRKVLDTTNYKQSST